MKPNTSKILPKEIVKDIKGKARREIKLKVGRFSATYCTAVALANTDRGDTNATEKEKSSWLGKVQRAFNQSSSHGATKDTRDVIGKFMECSDWNDYIMTKWPNLIELLDGPAIPSALRKVTKNSQLANFKLSEQEFEKFNLDGFDVFYLYYYLASDAVAKPAILCFKKDEKTKDWSNGRIYYLTNRGAEGKKLSHYKHSCTFDLERIEPAIREMGGTPQFLYYKGICIDATVPSEKMSVKDMEYQGKVGKYGSQANFYTFHCGRNVIDERYLFFANTSVINRKETKSVDTPSVQLTVIRRIEKENLFERIQEPVHPWISSVLIGKRIDFNEHLECKVFKNEAAFNKEVNILKFNSHERPEIVNEHYYCSSQVGAVYIGFYLRKSFGKNGGMAFMLLEAFKDGEVECTAFDDTQNEFVSYNGVFKFPIPKNKTAIVGDFLSGYYKASLTMFLRNIDNLKYSGVISGLSNNHTPYTSPIIFYRMSNKSSYKKIKDTYFPRRVSKDQINALFRSIKPLGNSIGIKNLANQVKLDLQAAEKECFGMIRNCL